ncbi:MAG: hypothetical protein J6V95_01380 [Bacteroidaceae bacterium]|nr:hypothetical protein [Bacteroidaceae bacterium]
MENKEIPQEKTTDEIVKRRNIIARFFHEWKERNSNHCCFNISLNENIYVRFVSITEICTHSSRTNLSTLAVMRLDEILMNARKVATVLAKSNGNQKGFEKMIVMHHNLPEIGAIKITVGVKRRTHEKILYCITSIDAKEKG